MPIFPFHADFFFFSVFYIPFYVFCTNINLCFNALSQLILFILSLLHSIFFLFHPFIDCISFHLIAFYILLKIILQSFAIFTFFSVQIPL